MSWLRSTPPGLLLAVLITLLRLLVIDIDPPVRDLTDYLPKDEGFYVFPAYDLYERGDAFVDHPFRITGIPTITNVGTYLGLVAFGDNYMGLRMGSVLFALVALLCFHALLSRITTDRILLNVLPLIMVSDLSFGFASIMVEPTIARMTMMLITMLWLSRTLEKEPSVRRVFLHGAGSALLVLLTYPTNAFILPACWLAIALITLRTGSGVKRSIKLVSVHVIGVVAGITLLLGLIWLQGYNELAQSAVAKDNFQHRVSLSPLGLLLNLYNTVQANIFRLDPALLLIFLGSVFFLFRRSLRRWSPALIIVAAFTIVFFAQTAFINDYPTRKLVILLPLALLVIAGSFEHSSGADPRSVRGRWIRWTLALILITGVLGQILFYQKNASFLSALVQPALIPGIAITLLVMALLLFRRAMEPASWWNARWVLCFLLVPGTWNSVRSMIIEREYAYADFMHSLRSYDGAVFIGAASMGFRTYNDIVPRLNPYVLPGGYNDQWPVLERMAIEDTTTNYAVGYLDDLVEFQRIGFHVDRIAVLNIWETMHENVFVVYKEKR
ncbi:MAG: hypothetical protein IT226_01955 [Flavobacteriales bacterium]|nr:hypothetical protein [Flavobacteriales bacterium]